MWLSWNGLDTEQFFRLAKYWNACSTPIQILLAFPGAPQITLDFKFSTWNNLSSLGHQLCFPRRSRQESLIFTKYVPDVSRKTNAMWLHSPKVTKVGLPSSKVPTPPWRTNSINTTGPQASSPPPTYPGLDGKADIISWLTDLESVSAIESSHYLTQEKWKGEPRVQGKNLLIHDRRAFC